MEGKGYELRLSKKTVLGKSQVYVRLTITRTKRPCFKSGVYIKPEWLKPSETKNGYAWEIKPPKQGKYNSKDVKAANDESTKLMSYISRILRVKQELSQYDEATKENIERAMVLTKDIAANSISYAAIKAKAKEKEEEDAKGKQSSCSIWDLMDEYLSEKEIAEGRKRSYRVLERIMYRYEGFVNKTDKERKGWKWNIHDINKDSLEDFFEYIENERQLSEDYPTIFENLLKSYPAECTPKHKSSVIYERGKNVQVEMKKKLKAFFRWLEENKHTTNRPFEDITIEGEVYGTPICLRKDERDTIADWDLSHNKTLEQQRDIFIFQCHIGCRVSDLLKMTKDNIVIDKKGKSYVEYIPKKTSKKSANVIQVPLSERASKLVDKYANKERERLFPFISSQKYNYAIKAILAECNITRMVATRNPKTGQEELIPLNETASSHLARRTFVDILYKQGVDKEKIASLTGHSDGSRAFARYRVIDMEIKEEIIKLIE